MTLLLLKGTEGCAAELAAAAAQRHQKAAVRFWETFCGSPATLCILIHLLRQFHFCNTKLLSGCYVAHALAHAGRPLNI